VSERTYKLVLIGIILLSLGIGLHFSSRSTLAEKPSVKIIDNQNSLDNQNNQNNLDNLASYRGVPVYYNGPDYTTDKGESFSTDGYYYGLKWQCVEYVKRFYYVIKHHKMPDVFGNAKDFFDPFVPQGGLNQQRELIQYINGGNEKPKPDDILVFTNTRYGHVAIVTKVTANSIEVIQQNEKDPRQVFTLTVNNHNFFVGTSLKPAGWLRIQ
jgi:hypothetical protein